MSLIKYNNRILSPGIIHLLNDVFKEEFNTLNRPVNKEFTPAFNVLEANDAFQLEMAVPGIKKDEINVELEEGVLTISSEKKEDKEEKKEINDNYSRREFSYSSFKKSFNIPEEVDASKINAKQENGVLIIKFPKKEVKAALKQMIKVA